jgi:hypothetical protein
MSNGPEADIGDPFVFLRRVLVMMGILQGWIADDGEAFFAVPIASSKRAHAAESDQA